MKYLQRRNDFLLEQKALSLQNIKVEKEINSSLLLRETFENDVTWGGSMLGRLINSTIRVAKIYYKTAKIGTLIPQLKKALDDLVEISRLSEQERSRLSRLKFSFLFEEIIKVVNSNKSTGEKIGILLGNESETNPGLVQSTISQIEKIEDLPDKETIIEKLKKFIDELKRIKESVGELPEPTEEEPETEGTKIFEDFFKLIEAIKAIAEILKKEKPAPTPGTEKKTKIQKGKEYTYTDPNGKKITVKVVEIKSGTTQGDPPKITVIPKNPQGQFDTTEKVEVDSKNLSESLIFEDVNQPTPQPVKVNPALTKIKNVFFKNNIFDLIPKMDQLKKDYEGGDEKYKRWINEIIQQVVLNEKTLGQPLKFQDLVKEALNVQQTIFAPLIKSISIVGKYLLPFKENMDQLSTMGELNKPIKDFIESYDSCKSIYSKKKSSSPEGGQSQTESGEDDQVKKAWRNSFSEEEEKKYLVNKKEAKELQESVDEKKKVEIDVNNGEQYDRILRIVEIFGKAYKMYAVDVIPSGRPNGRISQKTFRDYEYIGKEGGNRADWEEGKTPGYGPWAARITYEKWQDGVMGILEDTKYRTVLANSEFVNVGPEQKKGSGLTLFSFMNDMLNEGGDYSNFRQRRHALLTKYFNGGKAKELEGESGGGGANDNPPVKPEDAGTPKLMDFFNISQLKSPGYFESKNFSGEDNFLNMFLLVKGKSGNENLQFIIFIDDYLKNLNEKKIVIIKAHKQPQGAIKQSMISKYLKNKISSNQNEAREEEDVKLKLSDSLKFVENEPVYWGIIEFGETRILEDRKTTKIKLSTINDFTANKQAVSYDLLVSSVKILAYYSDTDKKNKKVRVKEISELPRGDKKDITSIIKNNGGVQSNFGIKKNP